MMRKPQTSHKQMVLLGAMSTSCTVVDREDSLQMGFDYSETSGKVQWEI
jgi:hypothetical protein